MIRRLLGRLVQRVVARRALQLRRRLGQLPSTWKAHSTTIVKTG